MVQPEKNTLETILVVEDHPIVRDAVCEILERVGFCVLACDSGAQAIQVESLTQATIHLLLSDVMIPDMSGLVVAHRLQQNRPEMRVMLMSGYPEGNTLILNQGWRFIEKPFLPSELVKRVTELLHAPERSHAGDRLRDRIAASSPGAEA